MIGTLFCGVTIGDGFLRHRHNQKLAQAAYDYGRGVGRVQGMCDTLQDVATANPDSEWAHDSKVVDALAACAKVNKQHGPGTTETIKLADAG
jgi:hypothetical protein